MLKSETAFAHHLRGVAILFVVIHHVFLLFWYHYDPVARLTGMPFYTGSSPEISQVLNQYWIVQSGLGSALFFLVGGFVVPFALDNKTRLEFLVTRFFRIWPPYVAGLILSLSAIKIASLYFHVAFVPTVRSILSSLLLSPTVLHQMPIDGVIWTLEIVVQFYVFVAFFPQLVRGKGGALLVAAGFFTLVSLLFKAGHHGFLHHLLMCVWHAGLTFNYMFMGILFHCLYTAKISFKRFVVFMLALFGLFSIQYIKFEHVFPDAMPFFTANCLMLVLFSFFYWQRRVLIFFKVFDGFANISYSLYASHAILSYVFLRIFLDKFHSPNIALVLCVIFILTTAMILHTLIEVPSHRFGRKVVRQFGKIRLLRQQKSIVPSESV